MSKSINYSDTTPVAPAGRENVQWQVDSSGTVALISASIPLGGGTGSGTVTSVDLTVPAELSVSGGPITTSGTLAITKATQAANKVWAGPTSGSAAAPTFRTLGVADVPTLATLGGVAKAGDTMTGNLTVPVVNATGTPNSINATGQINGASLSVSGDVASATSHTGTATVGGTLTANTLVSSGGSIASDGPITGTLGGFQSWGISVGGDITSVSVVYSWCLRIGPMVYIGTRFTCTLGSAGSNTVTATLPFSPTSDIQVLFTSIDTPSALIVPALSYTNAGVLNMVKAPLGGYAAGSHNFTVNGWYRVV